MRDKTHTSILCTRSKIHHTSGIAWRNQFRSCFFLQNLRLNDHSAAWQPGVNGSLSRGKLNTGDSVIDFKLNPEMGQRCSPETHWNESTQLSQAVLCSRSDVCTAIVTGS